MDSFIIGVKKTLDKKLEKLEIKISGLDEKAYSKTLAYLISKGFVGKKIVEKSIELKVIEQAKEEYFFVKKINGKGKDHPDHLIYPEFFAYALAKGNVFSSEETKNIRFDHGEDVDKFIELYSKKDLINDLYEELLHPKQFLKSTGKCDDIHSACC
jgi:hypothetical protein